MSRFSSGAKTWERRRKQLWLKRGMMVLGCDTTSFGLLVACIPRLPAGKIPPRDPKIYDRQRGGAQPAKGERGRAWGRAASLGKLASATALRRQSDWQQGRNVNLSVSVCMTNSLKATIGENKSWQVAHMTQSHTCLRLLFLWQLPLFSHPSILRSLLNEWWSSFTHRIPGLIRPPGSRRPRSPFYRHDWHTLATVGHRSSSLLGRKCSIQLVHSCWTIAYSFLHG